MKAMKRIFNSIGWLVIASDKINPRIALLINVPRLDATLLGLDALVPMKDV
jgi:hypothetical protein